MLYVREMNVREALIAARDLIADPTRHTVGAFARTASGDVTDPTSASATCWCAEGALYHVTGTTLEYRYSTLVTSSIEALRRVISSIATVPATNDIGGHSAVLAMYDRAIKRENDDEELVPGVNCPIEEGLDRNGQP